MALGTLAGFLAMSGAGRAWLASQAGYIQGFLMILAVFMGAVAGRLGSAFLATRRIARITVLLYQEGQPELFMEKFAGILRKTPKNTAEYVDGSNKMAYALEALGKFDRAMEIVDGLKPEELGLHSLSCQALTANQRLRLYLLKGDTVLAGEELVRLAGFWQQAGGRAPMLAANLKECVYLGENWLKVLMGQKADEEYLRQEIAFAKNRIHKGEMLILLGRYLRQEGRAEEAKELFREACACGEGLYAGRLAEGLLEHVHEGLV